MQNPSSKGECKRVNMRYRDPDFDTDWDLKWEKGYCLNGLDNRKFEMSRRAFTNPSSNVPKAVKRVHEIFDNPTFLKEKVSAADVRQGGLGDCWLMSSLTALANMEVGLHRICVEYDTKIGIYGFVFHRDGEWITSIVDDKLYLKSPDWDSRSVQRHLLELTDREDVEKEYRRTYQTGSQALFFAHCADPNETWLPLLEKAYAKAHGDFASLVGGWIGEGLEDLTGGVTTELLTSDILDIDEFWENEMLKVNKEFLFGCSTGLLGSGYGTRDGISEGHAYVIMEARELSTGERLLKLRNPWGKGKSGQWAGAWSDGSKELTPEAQIELKHKFGNDTVFWISYQDLLRKYQHFDRTRLFMDSPDWRMSQKWVSLDVHWKAEFQQMFKIVLKKESPIILVLSQLDDRYFDGLQGQYSYRLQFRLHELDSPEDEDYIVRSHGNYLMHRSVVTELKSLSPGTYTVHIMIAADRDPSRPSVEDVVKKECFKRVDNEKLAQVGTNYDYAHSKAAFHVETTTAARRTADKLKAREARIATRKNNWEMRRRGRAIMRKQNKKNLAKREAKEAKRNVNRDESDSEQPKDSSTQTDDVKDADKSTVEKGVQTDSQAILAADSDNTIVPIPLPHNENDKAVQTEDLSDSQSSVVATPQNSSVEGDPENGNGSAKTQPRLRHLPSKESVISTNKRLPFHPRDRYVPHSPAHPIQNQYIHMRGNPIMHGRPPPPRVIYATSEGESSASPIEDFDDMYSDDDPTLRPRPGGFGTGGPPPVGQGPPPPPGTKPKVDSDDEDDTVDPWNAVCVVGFRVYSQDADLELIVWDEGLDRITAKIDSITKEDGVRTESNVDVDMKGITTNADITKKTTDKGEGAGADSALITVEDDAESMKQVVAPP